MNKRKYRSILVILTVVCAVIGTTAHFRYSRRSETTYAEEYADDYREQQHWEAPAFKKLELHLSGGVVHLYDGSEGEYYVDYSGPEELRPSFTVQDGVMNISYAESAQTVAEYGSESAEYWITLGGYGLEEGNIHLDAGTIIIDQLRCSNCTVTCDAGTIECMNSIFRDVTFTIGAGDLYLHDIKGANVSAQIETGSANIDMEADQERSVRLETGLGMILVDEEEVGTLWEQKPEEESSSSLNVQTEVGDINFHHF